jgi:hypothetical protein
LAVTNWQNHFQIQVVQQQRQAEAVEHSILEQEFEALRQLQLQHDDIVVVSSSNTNNSLLNHLSVVVGVVHCGSAIMSSKIPLTSYK